MHNRRSTGVGALNRINNTGNIKPIRRTLIKINGDNRKFNESVLGDFERYRELILHIDRPVLPGNVVPERIYGALVIEGWALARSGVASIDIDVDGERLGTAYYGIRRRDVAEAFPDWDDAGASGFALMLPAAVLAKGLHRVGVELRSKTGLSTKSEFSIEIEQAVAEAGPSALRRKMPLSEVQLGMRILSGLGSPPHFGLLLAVGEVEQEAEAAHRTIVSLQDQVYTSWHVVIVRRGRRVPKHLDAQLRDGLEAIAGKVEIRLDVAADISLSSLAETRGQRPNLIGILLAGDVLGCDALLEMAIGAGLHPEVELFYSDERRISPVKKNHQAFFKPQWSPDLLTATNYIGRFWCAAPTVLNRAGTKYGEWHRFGDYDLILRCTEAASEIHHIAKVLCQRGRQQLDHPEQERIALERARLRRGVAGEVREGNIPGHFRLKRAVNRGGLVSIIIPTCAAKGLIKTCIETLRARTAYHNFEIICVENIPASQRRWKAWVRKHADRVLTVDEPFNWSRFNNLAAGEARGRFLLFLNDDVEIVEREWLEALLEHAQRPEVGVVGARLLYPDRKVQHAGIIWTPNGSRHAFRRSDDSDAGYFGLALTERNVIAVTGACFLVRRAEFEEMGGFDEGHRIVNNDVDFCLRCWERGKRVVFTPYAKLIHHEIASRRALDDDYDVEAFNRRWSRRLQAGDPFYHPYLSGDAVGYNYDPEPLETVYSGRPLFDIAQIRNILAVKLDHIGDFVTAIPALRRLQQVFPQARLSLLVAPASLALVGFISGLADVIEFEFFFPQSGLGQRNLSAEDFAALRDKLEPYHFDLAVDLRKAPETRPILRLTGARWLAGFDHMGQFPWLDVVMEWEQDPATVGKRNHIGDDLLRLADAISHAAAPNAGSLCSASEREEHNPRRFPELRGSAHGLVCVHPGVGSLIRQWPTRHFAELIDLLVAAHDVEIVLIGSRSERDIATEIIAKVQRPAAIRSVVGELPLAELPGILASAALFIGNNSGPQHLAAALGVPTIGIHSGTVDAREWGPVGPNAVAIRRNMICSPCYLSDPDDCWRGLACLTELRPIDVYKVCRRLLAINADAPTLQGHHSAPRPERGKPSVAG